MILLGCLLIVIRHGSAMILGRIGGPIGAETHVGIGTFQGYLLAKICYLLVGSTEKL